MFTILSHLRFILRPECGAFVIALGTALASCRKAERANADKPLEPEENLWGTVGQGGVGEPPSELLLHFKRLPLADPGGGTDMAFLPHAREMLITLREGYLYHVEVTDTEIVPIRKWQFQEQVFAENACGPTNIVLGPHFEESEFIYVSYCVDDQVTRLVRYNFTAETGPTNPRVIFETFIEEPAEDGVWHRIGSLGWEDDETMWMLVGDHVLRDQAQNVATPFGGVHRIVPNREKEGEGHVAASGNMLELGMTGPDGADPVPSLFAFGLRSPWRGTRDRRGRIFIGDVGLTTYEEVNLLSNAGQNFGWGDVEGPCFSDCDGFIDPIASYTRLEGDPYDADDPESVMSSLRAIWVGEIYDDTSVDRYHGLMNGVVPFGDFFTGWVRGLRVNSAGSVTMDEFIGHLEGVTQWRIAPDGYIYVLGLDGQIYVALLESN